MVRVHGCTSISGRYTSTDLKYTRSSIHTKSPFVTRVYPLFTVALNRINNLETNVGLFTGEANLLVVASMHCFIKANREVLGVVVR